VASLVILFAQYLRQKNYVLAAADMVLFGLAVGVVRLVGKTLARRSHGVPAAG
jgi:hypothetical protein